MKQSLYERLLRRFLISCIRRVMRRQVPRVIVVTGSLGKTSTRAAIAHAVNGSWPVYTRSLKSNFDRGPIMAFFGLRPNKNIRRLSFWTEDMPHIIKLSWRYPHELVVLELSEISITNQLDLVSVLQPTISVLTSIATVHASDHEEQGVSEQLRSLVDVSQIVLYNADFASLRNVVKGHTEVHSYGAIHSADFRLVSADVTKDHLTHFKIKHGATSWDIPSFQIGQHSGVAYSGAMAAVTLLQGKHDEAIDALSQLKPVRGRLNPLRGIRECLIIDDCYNANAISMSAALDTLARFPSPRVAVLGSMNEMGEHSSREHRAVGTKAAQSADTLVVVGDEAIRHLAPAAQKAGMKSAQIRAFSNAREAGVYLKRTLKPSSTVLGKGSQDGVYTEEALLPLVRGRDRKKLIRQTSFWRAKKDRYYASLPPAPTE